MFGKKSCIFSAVAVAALPALASAQITNGTFTIDSQGFVSGGVTGATGGGLTLDSSIGYPLASPEDVTNGTFSVYGGILVFNALPTDLTPPVLAAPQDTGEFSMDSLVSFTFPQAVDPESGVTSLSLVLGTAPGSSDLGSVSLAPTATMGSATVPDGPVFAFLRATNGDGLTTDSASSDGIFVDTQNVAVTLDGTPIYTNDPQPTYTGTFNDPAPSSGVDQITFRAVDNGLPTALFQATFDDSMPSGTWSGQQQIPLPVEGVYRFQFRGIDNAFNRQFTVLNDAIIFDQTSPVVSNFSMDGVPNGGFANGTVRVNLDYTDNLTDVIGFDPNDPSDLVTTGPSNLTITPVATGPDSFSFDVTPDDLNASGFYCLQVAAGAAEDLATNPAGGSGILKFQVDVIPPELECEAAFATVGGENQIADESFFVAATFNEPVTNVTSTAFNVSGATLLNVSPSPGPDTTFILELTGPVGSGSVSINSSVIEDLAGNTFTSGGETADFTLVPAIDSLPDPAPFLTDAPTGNERFGFSVDLSGPLAIAGAPGFGSTGAAYVLAAADPTTFTQIGLLQAANLDSGDNFGAAVAASGDWALIGAAGDDDIDDSSGAAYFFKFDDGATTGTEVQKATAGDFAPAFVGERLGRFGTTVDIDGNFAAVGQPKAGDGGSVFIYQLDLCDGVDGTWEPMAVLQPNDLTIRDEFGTSIELFGDTLVVGSRRDDDRGSDTGSVYVFERSGSNWNQIQKIVTGDADRLDQLGSSVSIDTAEIAFGAPGDDDVASGAGAAWIYERVGSSYFPLPGGKVTAPTSGGDGLGTAISIRNGRLLVAAELSDLADRDAGAVFMFGPAITPTKFISSVPTLYKTITFSIDPSRNDRFGTDVVLDGELGLMGNPFSDANGFNNGAVSFTGVEPDEID